MAFGIKPDQGRILQALVMAKLSLSERLRLREQPLARSWSILNLMTHEFTTFYHGHHFLLPEWVLPLQLQSSGVFHL